MVKYECRICRKKLDKDFCLEVGFICNSCDQEFADVMEVLWKCDTYLDATNEDYAEILKNMSIWIKNKYTGCSAIPIRS